MSTTCPKALILFLPFNTPRVKICQFFLIQTILVSAQFQFSYKNSLSIDNRSSYFQVLTIVEIDSAITCAACQNALPIPHICHLDHLHVGGEEICHVEKFQISIHGISPHEEEFQFFHTTDVEKCEFLPNLVKFHISPQDRCEEI